MTDTISLSESFIKAVSNETFIRVALVFISGLITYIFTRREKKIAQMDGFNLEFFERRINLYKKLEELIKDIILTYIPVSGLYLRKCNLRNNYSEIGKKNMPYPPLPDITYIATKEYLDNLNKRIVSIQIESHWLDDKTALYLGMLRSYTENTFLLLDADNPVFIAYLPLIVAFDLNNILMGLSKQVSRYYKTANKTKLKKMLSMPNFVSMFFFKRSIKKHTNSLEIVKRLKKDKKRLLRKSKIHYHPSQVVNMIRICGECDLDCNISGKCLNITSAQIPNITRLFEKED